MVGYQNVSGREEGGREKLPERLYILARNI